MTAKNTIVPSARPHSAILACVNAWERYYCWSRGLVPVGPLLLVGHKSYAGRTRTFADDTVLNEGDCIGVLHLNNARVSTLGALGGRHRIALQFSRMLRTSLQALAQYTAFEAGTAIAVYQGTTWMQPHGSRVGFVIEPFADTWRTTIMEWQFRMLRSCFAPISFESNPGSLTPRNFWITRTQLIDSFGFDVKA